MSERVNEREQRAAAASGAAMGSGPSFQDLPASLLLPPSLLPLPPAPPTAPHPTPPHPASGHAQLCQAGPGGCTLSAGPASALPCSSLVPPAHMSELGLGARPGLGHRPAASLLLGVGLGHSEGTASWGLPPGVQRTLHLPTMPAGQPCPLEVAWSEEGEKQSGQERPATIARVPRGLSRMAGAPTASVPVRIPAS